VVPGIPENHDAFIVKGQGVQFAMNQDVFILVQCIVVNTAFVLTAFKEGTIYRHTSCFIVYCMSNLYEFSELAGSD